MQSTPDIRSFAGLAALDQFAAQIDALNRSSARPNPYLSADYLRCFARYNEYFPDSDDDIRLYTAWERGQLIGCLPLRQVDDHFGPLRASRICFLAPFDVDQPGLLCAPENEERVACAIVQHILDHTPRFGMLELMGQRPESALYKVMRASKDMRFRVRDIEVEPFSEIPIDGLDLKAYFRSLSSSWRQDVARHSRKLLGAGTTEVVFADGAQATSAWFDAYLDLENRSWKHNTPAAIARAPRREELYQHLLAGRGGFIPSFVGILMDGVLIAGSLNGSNADAPEHAQGMWGLEIAYDASYAYLSPGQLLALLTVHTAILHGKKFINLLHSFSHYKHHWKAETITVKNVQLIRRWSLHNLRGLIGDLIRALRRKLQTAQTSRDMHGNNGTRQAPAHPNPAQARTVTTQALAYAGPGIQCLTHAEICALLPFDARSGKQA